MCSANPVTLHTIAAPETLSAQIKAVGRQSCSDPVLLDLSTLEAGTNELHCAAWLSEQERQDYRCFNREKRNKEWLAGRICAKIALEQYFRTYCQGQRVPACVEITIANSGTGRPIATWNDGKHVRQGPDISISHSGNLALAMAAQTCCGVDIQKTSSTLVRVKERFCTAPEERLLLSVAHKDDPHMHLAQLWAAKEAAKKALSISSMPGFLELVLVRIEQAGRKEPLFIFRRHSPRNHEIIVVSTWYQTYGLGICIPEEKLDYA
jgi:phosphopantetheinyl transferase